MGELDGDSIDQFTEAHFKYIRGMRALANSINKSPKRSHMFGSGLIPKHELVNKFGTIRRLRQLAGVDDIDRTIIADWMAENLESGRRSFARSKHIHNDTGIDGTAIGMLLSRNEPKEFETSDGRVVKYEKYNDAAASTTNLYRFWFEE